MATQTKQDKRTNGDNPYAAYAPAHVHELNERLVESSRRNTTVYLDSYERGVKTVADFEERIAAATPNAFVASLITAHADLSREIAKVQVSAARQLVAA